MKIVITAYEARELQSLNRVHDLTEVVEAISERIKEIASTTTRSHMSYSVEGFLFEKKQKLLTYFKSLDYECYISQGMCGEVITIKW